MKTVLAAVCFVALLGADASNPLDRAAAAFAAGDFTGAHAAYVEAVAASPGSGPARLGLGRLELYGNDLAAATRDLTAASGDPASAKDAQRYLGIAASRTAEFGRYDAALAGRTIRVPFLQRDPLPMVAVVVNGKPAHFLIDTGGPDIVIDPDFAKEIGATVVDGGSGVFAGGRRAAVQRTMVDSFALGGLTVAKQAAGVLPTRGLPFGGNTTIDGVIGTGFLMHFLATIDYGHDALILAPRENVVVPPGATSVPMWLVGDHFIFARGAINGVPMLMLIDTGLAGGGVMPIAASVAAAHIALDEAHATQGIGGGGPVTAVPFVAKSVALGTFTRADVGGLYTPEGSPLSAFPFAVGGAVSHGFFSPGALTFDFTNMRLIVTK